MAEQPEEKGAKRRKTGSSDKNASGPVISDPRFANIQSDPRFRLPSKRHTHVKLDKRFAHMLRDDDFSRNAAVDRYGRKLRKDDTKKQLERFYRLEDDEGEEQGERDTGNDDDEEIEKERRRVEKSDYDPARHGGFSSSESSSDEESEEEVEDDVLEPEFPDQQQDDVPIGDITERIAVVNLDWDHIRAEDLMAVFSSFLPPGGRIVKVSIYPSEFGRERMEREEMEGPPKELFAKNSVGENEQVDEEEDEEKEEQKIKQNMLKEGDATDFNSTQLRKYQIERLRYFYGVLTFSSKEAAKNVYDTIDGAEYLSSANFLDLRFIPDDTDFAEDTPRDECVRIPAGYKPSYFVTDALQHSKVKLTWDADDPSRKEAQARAFKGGRKEIDENDFKAYLGSDSSEEEDENGNDVNNVGGDDATRNGKPSKKEAERAKLRSLLGFSDKPAPKAKDTKDTAPVGDMEVTFSAGLSAAPTRESVFENEPEEETTREKYVRKERERKQRRKANHKNKMQDEPVAAENGGKMAENDSKKRQEQDLGFDDPFFTAPEKDATAGGKKSKEEKRNLREQRQADEAASAAKRAELELLMVDDKPSEINHFDMNEIEKAAKHAKKKHKKGKKAQQETRPDHFKMDVQDPRFQRLWDSHEFAIDPTNPRFKNTQGMKDLLEEGRKRRRHKKNDEPDGESGNSTKKKKKHAADKSAQGEDLNRLVERVKGKAKQKE